MLTHFSIQNYLFIDNVALEFQPGLTVITGETGAGKSIVIDALTLLLGARLDTPIVGTAQDRCNLSACFDVKANVAAIIWLEENEFNQEPTDECIIRRVIFKDGKSRQMINGHNCTLQQIKELLPMLVNMHGQNQHQLLTKRGHQRELLDQYANNSHLAIKVKNAYQLWLENINQIEKLRQIENNGEAQLALLGYQIQEFEKMNLQAEEYVHLDHEHKQLANASQLLQGCQEAITALSELEKFSAQDQLYKAQQCLTAILEYDAKIQTASEMINSAIINLEEAVVEIRNFVERIEINPERLSSVENRLSKLHDLARKYQVPPQTLNETFEGLKQQQAMQTQAKNQYELLIKKSAILLDGYLQLARELHANRQQAAQTLNEKVTNELHKLGMSGGTFKIELEFTEEPSANGSSAIDFLVATNPGQSLQPLAKIASGGEISRIALAIYVITAQNKTTPILVFDEVDVGIGGHTAAIVGNLLKALSQSTQVLCITHLPQVASYGDHHFQVQKKVIDNQTSTHIVPLSSEQRVQEIARMLGGVTITEKTLAHAKELISNV